MKTSDPSAISEKNPTTKKRRKRRPTTQMLREKLKATTKKDRLSQIEEKKPEPVGPSPAVLALQAQVVDLVNQRGASRQRVTQAHAAYLLAQGTFQATQGELQGIEQEVQYRIGLIAQLENRAPQQQNLVSFPDPYNSPGLSYPASLNGISSEPATQPSRQLIDVIPSDPSDVVNRGHAAALRAQI